MASQFGFFHVVVRCQLLVCWWYCRGWAAGGGGCGVRSRSSDGSVVRRRTRQIIDLNGVHVNPARPWQLVVGGADEAVVVYDNRILTSLTTSYGGGSIGGADDASVGCRQVEGRPLFELCPSNLRRTADLSVRHRPTHVTCVIFSQNGMAHLPNGYFLRTAAVQGPDNWLISRFWPVCNDIPYLVLVLDGAWDQSAAGFVTMARTFQG